MLLLSCSERSSTKKESAIHGQAEVAGMVEKNTVAEVEKVECNKLDLPGFSPDSVYNRYIKFLNSLDCDDPESISHAGDSLVKIMTREDTIRADSAFLIFNEYYELVTNSLRGNIVSDTTNYLSFIAGEGSGPQPEPTEAAKKYYRSLQRNGFDFGYPEGTIDIEQDRDFMEKKFYKYLSLSMRSYLAQMNVEYKDEFLSDGGINLSEEEFLRRILWWEKFTMDHPSFLHVAEAEKLQKRYLYFSLRGIENTPLFTSGDGKLTEYFKNLYELALQSSSDSPELKILNEHYGIIKKHNGKDSEERQNFITNLEKEKKIEE